jgi:hypothetical protein
MAEIENVPTDELWAELRRRGAAKLVGYCYPAATRDPAVEDYQLLELGDRLAEPPHWPMYAQVPAYYIEAKGRVTDRGE